MPAWIQSLGGEEVERPAPCDPTSAVEPAASEGAPGSGQPWLTGLGSDEGEPPAPAQAPLRAASAEPVGQRKVFVAGGIAAIVVIVVAGVALLLSGVGATDEADVEEPLAQKLTSAGVLSPSPSAPPSPTQAQTSADAAPAAKGACESRQEGTVVFGDGAGDMKSTAGVVLAFQHAYYVDRSADEAFKVMADDSAFQDKGKLQEGIDSVPEDTTHCLEIRPSGDTSARVTVTESRPDVAPQKFHLEAETVREDDGEVRLVSLRGAE